MKAALLIEPGRVLIDEVPEPVPGPGEVRISVRGIGLCGSDSSVFSGKWEAPSYPWIMGHEAFGTIDSLGPGVDAHRLGNTVVVEPNLVCLSCAQCRRGWTSACTNRQSIGMNRPGAIAEKLVVPGRFAWPVTGVPATDLVCVEPTTVALAAIRRFGMPMEGPVLVVGVGALGLVMSLVLMEHGVEVHVLDTNPARLDLAERLGALSAEAGGSGSFMMAVDTVGSPASMTSGLERLEVGGTLLCLGLDGRPLDLTAQALVRGQVTLRGSLTYDHPIDFEAATALIAEGGLSPGRVVTDEYSLDEAQIAFERSGSVSGKTWIRISN